MELTAGERQRFVEWLNWWAADNLRLLRVAEEKLDGDTRETAKKMLQSNLDACLLVAGHLSCEGRHGKEVSRASRTVLPSPS